MVPSQRSIVPAVAAGPAPVRPAVRWNGLKRWCLAFASVLVLSQSARLSAQSSPAVDRTSGLECPTVPSPEQWAWLQAFQLDDEAQEAALRGGTQYVAVKAHVVGKDDKSGYYRHAHLLESICRLNAQFAATGLYFYLDLPIAYHNNALWWDQSFSDGFGMIIANNVPNALNVYYVGSIENGGIAGYYSPGADGVVMYNSAASPGSNTLAHEFGHFFSLPHTFYGWEGGDPPPISQQERVDGSNCNTAADGFCDTPPDYAYYRWSCPAAGPFTDPSGASFEVVDSFFMSYGGNGCRDRFSPQQSAAMRANLNGPHAAVEGFIEPFFPAGYDSSRLLKPLDGSVLVPPIGQRFAWTSVQDAVGYHVTVSYTSLFSAVAEEAIVQDTFWTALRLPEDRKLHWKVKPIFEGNTCEPYSGAFSFTTGLIAPPPTGLEEQVLAAVQVFPNPATAGSALRLDAPLHGIWKATWTDALGRQVLVQEQQLDGASASRWKSPLLPAWYVVQWRSPSGESFRQPVLLR